MLNERDRASACDRDVIEIQMGLNFEAILSATWMPSIRSHVNFFIVSMHNKTPNLLHQKIMTSESKFYCNDLYDCREECLRYLFYAMILKQKQTAERCLMNSKVIMRYCVLV